MVRSPFSFSVQGVTAHAVHGGSAQRDRTAPRCGALRPAEDGDDDDKKPRHAQLTINDAIEFLDTLGFSRFVDQFERTPTAWAKRRLRE